MIDLLARFRTPGQVGMRLLGQTAIGRSHGVDIVSRAELENAPGPVDLTGIQKGDLDGGETVRRQRVDTAKRQPAAMRGIEAFEAAVERVLALRIDQHRRVQDHPVIDRRVGDDIDRRGAQRPGQCFAQIASAALKACLDPGTEPCRRVPHGLTGRCRRLEFQHLGFLRNLGEDRFQRPGHLDLELGLALQRLEGGGEIGAAGLQTPFDARAIGGDGRKPDRQNRRTGHDTFDHPLMGKQKPRQILFAASQERRLGRGSDHRRERPCLDHMDAVSEPRQLTVPARRRDDRVDV